MLRVYKLTKVFCDTADIDLIKNLKCIKILALAEVMLKELKGTKKTKIQKPSILEIGSKPGEKLYEELMSDEEASRSIELDEFFCILPAFRQDYKKINYSYKKPTN